jgi:hypothetical protein
MYRRMTSGLALVIGIVLATGLALIGGGSAQSATDGLPQGSEPVNLNPTDFTLEIDNPFFPLRPGSRWVYRETDKEGAKQKVVVTVTDQTRLIANGVLARVVHDVVSEDGKPTEVTDDWYAQDSAGNVWYLGEATAEFAKGRPVSTAGSWEAGVDGAQPGVIMPAKPRRGMTYRQEFYAGEAEDRARVVRFGAKAKVPLRRFGNLLKTKDINPLGGKSVEFKFYARRIGLVQSITVKGGSDREELVKFRRG